MDFITKFYNGLETLDLIIFWGIIIVIILLLVFFVIIISKNKKTKKNIIDSTDEKKEISYNEEIPIKKSITLPENLNKENSNNSTIKENNIVEDQEEKLNVLDNQIEIEKNFIAEEHIMEFNNNKKISKNDEKELENKLNNNINDDVKKTENVSINYKKKIEMPTGPYQRNVLREMSLGQTSPIGITSPKRNNETQLELAKELEESLNIEKNEEFNFPKEINKENIIVVNEPFIKQQLKNESLKTKDIDRKTENVSKEIEKIEKKLNNDVNSSINHNNIDPRVKKILNSSPQNITKNEKIEEKQYLNKEHGNIMPRESEKIKENEYLNKNESQIKNNSEIGKEASELLNSVSNIVSKEKQKSSSEIYLEEVSRKLAEAEIPDEIERTEYELEQEENAIISYTELMEKKDSIQTIDEEEAVISIEELMNRNKIKDEIKTEKNEAFKENNKLYNLNEEEKNEDFIKELKQFRNDL